MKNCKCGGETVVTETREIEGQYRRRRKCVDCGEAYFTVETYLAPAYRTSGEVHKKRRVEVPKPDDKGLYTKQDAATVKKIKVENRRKNEDIRTKMRIPSYFIEDDFDSNY